MIDSEYYTKHLYFRTRRMKTTKRIGSLVPLILLSVVQRCRTICSPVYGSGPCSFLPAPPGHTPPCARPGSTYCEHPSHYPSQLIHYLIEKWRYDHSTLLSDESRDDFTTYYYLPPDVKYGFNNIESYGPPNSIQQDNLFPQPIHVPKPAHPRPSTYLPPPVVVGQHGNFTDGFAGYPNRRTYNQFSHHERSSLINYKYPMAKETLKYEQQPHILYDHRNSAYTIPVEQPVLDSYQTGDIWKRNYPQYNRSKRSDKAKNTKKKFSHIEKLRNVTDNTEHVRYKRQSALTGQTLCQSRSQYIMPKAALNNKGNWMYVVNMGEIDNRFTQLVKSETCVSQTCSGLCGLPNGYTSRCEQKYVQKRLVALEGSGNQLYTDVFWFPSCCVCTVTNT